MEGHRQKDPWDLLASQQSLIFGALVSREDLVSENQVGGS